MPITTADQQLALIDFGGPTEPGMPFPGSGITTPDQYHFLWLVSLEGGVIPPEPPEVVGGGGKVYGRGFPRKRWEELLALLEAERQEALQRAQAFTGKKDQARARKAARAASEAIAAAREVAEEAAILAHAGDITRMLEGAADAKRIAEYLTLMEEARRAAVEMMEEDEVETILMLVS